MLFTNVGLYLILSLSLFYRFFLLNKMKKKNYIDQLNFFHTYEFMIFEIAKKEKQEERERVLLSRF